jgi:hypothetical protein
MRRLILHSSLSRLARFTRVSILVLTAFCAVRNGTAQQTPLISGGVGFFSSTNGGNTSYLPTIQPLIAAPIGSRFLIESRAVIGENFSPGTSADPGYEHMHFATFDYLQGSYFLTPHLTVVGGSYLIPFNTYNDRLSELWIENFQDAPLIATLGTMGSGSGLGGMLSGSAFSRRKFTINYNAWFASRSSNQQFDSKRSPGGRVSIYLPEKRLEIGASYDRLLQGTQENFTGAFVWWEPKDTAFRLRSEFARGQHSQGYWIEADYRTQAFGGLDSWVGRFEPVFRMQQTFRIDNSTNTDGLPGANTQRTDFGLDYNLPHNTRILTSYARQFSSAGNTNVWETGIVYRFLFPVWKGKGQ